MNTPTYFYWNVEEEKISLLFLLNVHLNASGFILRTHTYNTLSEQFHSIFVGDPCIKALYIYLKRYNKYAYITVQLLDSNEFKKAFDMTTTKTISSFLDGFGCISVFVCLWLCIHHIFIEEWMRANDRIHIFNRWILTVLLLIRKFLSPAVLITCSLRHSLANAYLYVTPEN